MENAQAHLVFALCTPNPEISLSTRPEEIALTLQVKVRQIVEEGRSRALTISTSGSVLDNGGHTRNDGIFAGAFLGMNSINPNTPDRRLPFNITRSPHHGNGRNISDDLQERDWVRFVTVPAPSKSGDGNVMVKHDLTFGRLFGNAGAGGVAGPQDIQVGEKFSIRLNPQRLLCPGSDAWWSWATWDELQGKKLKEWLIIQDPLQQARLEKDGWVLSNDLGNLIAEAEEGMEQVVVEFVK